MLPMKFFWLYKMDCVFMYCDFYRFSSKSSPFSLAFAKRLIISHPVELGSQTGRRFFTVFETSSTSFRPRYLKMC